MALTMNPESLARLQSLARGDDHRLRLETALRSTAVGAYLRVAVSSRPGLLEVRDEEDGDTRLFDVTAVVSPLDVIAMLNYAKSLYYQGVQQGELNARAQMREALGFKD